jgi:DNA adenine methylase
MTASPTRPALRYLGGKWRLAPRIISHFPAHRVYVEPFGGGGSVLLRKPPADTEIYNDLDGDLVNLFRVLRDEASAARLCALVDLTPFARAEFDAAYEPCEEPVERARRLVVRAFMGHGNIASRIDRTTGFRGKGSHGANAPERAWCGYPAALAQVARRIKRVRLENIDAGEVIASDDGPGTLFYVDPPYVHSTRSEKREKLSPSCGYRFEMSDAQHLALIEQLRAARGMVVLSGYPHPLYDQRLGDWRRIEMAAHADGARERTEVLWINPAACDAHGLFGAAA